MLFERLMEASGSHGPRRRVRHANGTGPALLDVDTPRYGFTAGLAPCLEVPA